MTPSPPQSPPLVPAHIHDAFGLPSPDTAGYRQAVASVSGTWQPATRTERDAYVRYVLDLIRAPRLQRSETENREAWQRGWGESLAEARLHHFSADALRPRYFRDSQWLRWGGDVVCSSNPQLEHDCFTVARHVLFSHFLGHAREIWEIGSGSGQNLRLLSELFPATPLRGLDFVQPAVDIANGLAGALGRPISGATFDMLRPPAGDRCPPGCAVVTVHAMEQLGDRFEPLLNWLLDAEPQVVLHYEPIVEYYDTRDLLDYIAHWYCDHRKYLVGYWPALLSLAQQGRIELLYHGRPYLGGAVHEASVVAWRPVGRGGEKG